jgi:hypothetical protein
MADIRGKFVDMATKFISSQPDIQEKAKQEVKRLTGKLPSELEPDGWYDASVLNSVFQTIRKNTDDFTANTMIQVAGMEIFYVIKESGDVPPELKSSLDWIRFEADAFVTHHRGSDAVPRKFIKAESGHIVVEAFSPGYDCTFIEGCFMGILRMNGDYNGTVKQTRCVKNGDSTCEFDIRW